MEIDKITVIIALSTTLITSLAAILTPVLTAIINNRHKTKEKKIESSFIVKLQTYNDFFADFGKYRSAHTHQTHCEFLASSSRVLLVCDHESREHVKALIGLPKDAIIPVMLEHFLKCSESLIMDLDKSRDRAYS